MKKTTIIKNFALQAILFFSASSIGAATYSGGDGSVASPYLISTKADLLTLSNPANKADWASKFLLTADIDMAGETVYPIGFQGGEINTPFTGVFDGGNKAISNLTLKKYEDQGLGIGFIGLASGANCIVKNLGIKNININIPQERMGGIVGFCRWGAQISNCFVYGGSISGQGRLGGICGYLVEGTISNCLSKVSITDTWGGSQGGIAGTVSNNAGTIRNCVNYAIQKAGNAISKIDNSATPTFTDNIYIEDDANVGLVGEITTGSSVSASDLLQQAAYSGFDFTNTWAMLPNSYAVLKSFPANVFSGIESNGTTSVDYLKSIGFKYAYSANNNKISFDNEIVNATVYSLNGSLVMKSNEKSNSISLANLSKGIYLVKATLTAGDNITVKISK